MKKVLIVSYDYYPLAHAASYMVQSRGAHLAACGWEPVVLTRHWDADSTDVFAETDQPLKKDHDPVVECTVYRTAYKQSFKSLLKARARFSSNSIRFKLLNFFLRTFCLHPCEHRGWHPYAVEAGLKIVKEENISAILSVGSPWSCHWISADISQKSKIPWVASYMDPWNQSPSKKYWYRPFSWKWCLSKLISICVENNTAGKANCAAHNSTPWAQELQHLIGVKTHSITHGVDADDLKDVYHFQPDSKCLTLSYIGSLHFTQKTDVFFQGLSQFFEENQIDRDKFQVQFIGCPAAKSRYQQYANVKGYVREIAYLPREQAQEYMMQSHILLLFLINDDGWYPMKVFEYLSTNAQILATPRDHGVIDKILTDSGKGITLDTPSETAGWLKEKWKEFLENGKLTAHINKTALDAMDRRKNVQMLAQILDDISRVKQ